jgi:dihydroorotate dehydrogenase (NAD+) catalytic subunit
LTVNISTTIAGVSLRNPTILAAGVLGLTAASLLKVWKAGAGAVVTKSVGIEPREGFKNPTIVDVGCGFINAMGLPNPGVEEFIDEIKTLKHWNSQIRVIASIYGGSLKDFIYTVEEITQADIDAIELNVSCPHVKKMGLEVGQDPVLLGEIVESVKSVVGCPVFTKLSPNTSNIQRLASIIEAAGGDGVVAVNTLRAMAINIETGRPILGNRVGGLSGPALKPVALRCVYEIAQTVSIPVIGCGGIMNWQDVIEYFYAGAQAVQIGSAIAYRDLGVFDEITKGIRNFLDLKGYRSVEEIVGLSFKD